MKKTETGERSFEVEASSSSSASFTSRPVPVVS